MQALHEFLNMPEYGYIMPYSSVLKMPAGVQPEIFQGNAEGGLWALQ